MKSKKDTFYVQTCIGDVPELSEGRLRTGVPAPLLRTTSGCFWLSFLVDDEVDRMYEGILKLEMNN